MTIPPFHSPRAYATHLLEAWRSQLIGTRQVLPGNTRLVAITQELARRKAAAIPTKK